MDPRITSEVVFCYDDALKGIILRSQGFFYLTEFNVQGDKETCTPSDPAYSRSVQR